MPFCTPDYTCALAESPVHDIHLHIRSILDALQLELSQLEWKVSDRRGRRILVPSSNERETLYPTRYRTLEDAIGTNLDNCLKQ